MFAAPAGLCDEEGTLVGCNDAFAAWAGRASLGARVTINGTRGTLPVDGETRTLTAAALVGGGWLVVGAGDPAGAISAVTTLVAHRLGRVETALSSYAEMALQAAPNESVARTLREVLAVAEEIKALREQTEALGGTGLPHREPVCLLALLRDAVRLVHPQLVRIHAAPDADHTAIADRSRLFPLLIAVLQELGDGDVTAVLTSGERVRIELRSAQIPRAETPAITTLRRLLDDSQGRLLLDTHAVAIELPAYGDAITSSPGQGTILVVDDNEPSLAMMGATLRKAGFRVLTAEDGVIGSSLLRLHLSEIVAIVTDAVLPGRSGLDLIAEARRSQPDMPVLLISGHSVDLLGGPNADTPVLKKPIIGRVLVEQVRALLDR